MKFTFQTAALSAALTLAAGMPSAASAKTTHHSKRPARHHVAASHRRAAGHSSMTKGGMKAGSATVPTAGMANPAMSTAPATSGGDKP